MLFTTGNEAKHAFLYSNGTMQDLGTLGGGISEGYAHQRARPGNGLCGRSPPETAYHAFLHGNGIIRDLGTLGGDSSEGYGINDSGQVTGTAQTTGNAAYHAFIYSNGRITDLNSLISSTAASLFTLTAGQAINDGGQIVVNATVNATGENVALLLTPTAIPTSTSLTSSASSSTYGTPVTLAALVTPSSGSTPSGRVTFYAGAAHLATVTLNGAGQAVLTTNAIPAGAQSLTVTYAGNPTDLASTSSPVEVTVSADSTTTTLVASPTTGTPGTSITLTATVNPMSGTAIPKGKVTFKDGTTTLAVVELNESGVATYTTTTLSVGTDQLTAYYGGNADEVKSVSAAVTVTIT